MLYSMFLHMRNHIRILLFSVVIRSIFRWYSKRLLFSVNWAIQGENKFIFDDCNFCMCTLPNDVKWFLVLLSHYSKGPQVDISVQSDILLWLRVNQFFALILLFCLVSRETVNNNSVFLCSTEPWLSPSFSRIPKAYFNLVGLKSFWYTYLSIKYINYNDK